MGAEVPLAFELAVHTAAIYLYTYVKRKRQWHFRIKNTIFFLAFRWGMVPICFIKAPKSRKSHSCAVRCLHLFLQAKEDGQIAVKEPKDGFWCPCPPPTCPYCSKAQGMATPVLGDPKVLAEFLSKKRKRWSSEFWVHTTSQVSVFSAEFQIWGSRCLWQCSALQKYKRSEILKIKSWTRLINYLDSKLHCKRRSPK